MNVVETLKSAGIIPVIVIEDEAKAVPLANALVNGGLPVLEVTFRTKAAAGAIAKIKAEVPNAVVGAGTLLTKEQVKAAKEAGITKISHVDSYSQNILFGIIIKQTTKVYGE